MDSLNYVLLLKKQINYCQITFEIRKINLFSRYAIYENKMFSLKKIILTIHLTLMSLTEK